MKGYRNRPEATAAAMHGGWFRTRDLATVDEDGFYYIVDRKKDMVIRGGYNVYPREIEEVLYEHPRHVWLTDGLPKGPTGKLLKREITVPADVLSATAARS
jgi:long-chain acyl-CoA synthetase